MSDAGRVPTEGARWPRSRVRWRETIRTGAEFPTRKHRDGCWAVGLARLRTDAASRATDGIESTGIGLREWLGQVRTGRPHIAAAFGTRVHKPLLPGSAARGALRLLRKRGFALIGPAADLYVEDILGPVGTGELERAQRWGEQLATAMTELPGPRQALT